MLQLKKFPDISVSTREEARECHPHPQEPRFSLIAREEGSFPCVVGKEVPVFPSHLMRRRSPQEKRRNSRVVPPFQESPRYLSLPGPSPAGSREFDGWTALSWKVFFIY